MIDFGDFSSTEFFVTGSTDPNWICRKRGMVKTCRYLINFSFFLFKFVQKFRKIDEIEKILMVWEKYSQKISR